ncbi:MAG: hypothetical protein HY819_04605 [Acidobacteria bacterium]|nr:hypothetical protein [Acidobacteriota bacterium]
MRWIIFFTTLLVIFTSLSIKAKQSFTPNLSTQNKIESIYTDLSSDKCKTLELDEESAFSSQLCQGIEGYKLLIEDFDARTSITIVSPDGKKHPLRYPEVITYGFSSLGEKAEWRVIREGKIQPIALITRLNANENPENYKKITSYLVVSKITKNKICVVAKILPTADANSKARQIADNSTNKPCLESKIK